MPTVRAHRQPALGKLSPPRLGRVFGREHLFARIDAAAAAPGLWMAGPPGSGKTTLVATWLHERSTPCLWLQLDAGDADPATFAHFLRAAAAHLAPRRQLHLPLPGADDLRDVPAFIRRCFRRLALALDRPWVLVLDNAQELGSAPLLHAGIAAALAELPDRVRLIAISREPPPPEYARAIANQHLVMLDEPSLRFTDDDTQRLVDLHGRDWPAARLRELTDGWPAAMILLLAARTSLGPEDSLRSGTARGRLFDFFAGEVMEKLGPADAAALMRIAFLPSASAAMAVALSGDPRSGELLADLARRSLFTERREGASSTTERREGTPPAYTFHALFGEFLRARAADTLGAEALQALRVEAAAILAAHGQVDAAIARLIDASAWGGALHLLLAHAAAFVAQGRTQVVRDWLLALPLASRAGPQACYWLGYCELAVRPTEALEHFELAHREFVAAGDAQGAFFTAAAAVDAIVYIGERLSDIEPWMPMLKAHLPVYLANRQSDTDLRVLPGLLAAFVYRETAHPLTATLAGLAERMLDQPQGASQRILLGTLAYYLLWTGQLARLDRIIVKIDRTCAESDAAPATLLRWYGVVVIIRSLLGRVDEALAHARRALALTRQGPAPMRAKAHLAMVLAAVAARDAELARTHLAEAAQVIDPGNAIDATVYEYQRGMLMLLDGDWHGAAQLMRAAVVSGRSSGWPLREHIAMLGHALAATQVGAFDEAEAVLAAALAHPFHAVCRWHHWIGALIEAQLAERRGDRPRCLAALARAFAVGRESGYDFGPMPYCCGDMMSRLALLAIENGVDAPFALAIVRRYALPAPAGAGERWPWPIRVRTLGRFVIEHDGAPVPAARKESRKPLDLLKLLIAFGGEAVPVARLCAALWPEAQGDAARNSFDNALHRLRKLLIGDGHVLLRGGAVSLNAGTCWTDLAALDACFAEVDSLRPDAGFELVSALAERALALCQGEFLASEDELPDVLAARARTQARFARQMLALGTRLEGQGQAETAARLYERVAEQQPLAEEVHRRLIVCLLALGRRAEAYEVYRRCRQQLSVVLGIRPAPETEALVAALRDL